MRSRTWILFFLLLILTGSAAAVLALEERRGRESTLQAEAFQRLIGGMGFGPALDLSSCGSDFDPRLEGNCSMNYGPIAGGACFSFRQGNSVFFYPSLKQGTPSSER